MKIALIGQDVPTLLPALLTDLLFAGAEANAEVTVEEGNPAMQELLQGYGEKIFAKAGKGGSFQAFAEREKVLEGADCVIYAGDCQAASRFFQDRNALGSDDEDNPGLTDQARVNGGIEGLLHALRAGEMILKLCDDMDKACPKALRGANGIDTYAKRLQIKPENVQAVTAGLPGFAFLTEMKDGKTDLLNKLKKAADNGELGSLARRWLGWWDAIPVGDVTDHAEFLPAQEGFIPEDHAEFLPAQEGFIPEERPEFGETVEKRKERILYMNTVREQGADSREGAMAQLLLLSKVPPVRPMKLALALLRKETAEIPAVARKNNGVLPQLPKDAIIETALVLKDGKDETPAIRVPEALADILGEVDNANRLAAKAAFGDREALRECVETDPALDGLDRLYCLDVVNALIEMHADVLKNYQ